MKTKFTVICFPILFCFLSQLLTLLACLSPCVASSGDSSSDILSREERVWLTENQGRVILAVETGYAPFVFLDSKGKTTGLAEDYMRLLESKLGIHFKRRTCSSLDDIFMKIRGREVHIVNAVTKTDRRSEFLDFTEPFISVPNVIIVRKERSGQLSEKNLAGLKVSMVQSYAVTEHLSQKGLGFVPDLVPDDLSALLNVSLGLSDAAVIDLATGSYLIDRKSITNLRVAGEVDYAIQLAIGSDRREPVLHGILQKGLDAASDAERQEIHDRWINLPVYNIMMDWRFWLALGGALCVILAVIVIIFVWNRMLRRQVAMRTRELADEKDLIAVTLDSIVNGVVCTDVKARITIMNPAAERLSGWTAKEALGLPLSKALSTFTEMDRVPMELPVGQVIDSGLTLPLSNLALLVSRTGEEHHVIVAAAPIRGGADAPLRGVVLVIQDITDQKRAEAQHEKLEAQFHQSQKLESIGQLAGGVAHDFNNMLSVINGYSEVLLGETDPLDPRYPCIQEINRAGERSAALTRQLLAFARKQLISPKVLSLNDTVSEMHKMLLRIIGENIELLWKPAPDLWKVKMDPSQVNQVLSNLIVNSRDAISSVGRVTIETGNVFLDEPFCRTHPDSVPGEHVLLEVADCGCGMSKETLEHIFEPFFTTKKVGEGTGLGLATVFGIVKQNKGFIDVCSEPGKGTAFKIYLPRFESNGPVSKENSEEMKVFTGAETILLVEDETSLLQFVKSQLERLGYTVLAADSPVKAIRLAEEYKVDIHLLMTDVVLPEMSGRDLKGEINRIRPGIRCLFMSGYTAEIVSHNGVLDEGVHFLEKPFTTEKMSAKIREALL
jgi:two-component system sensor histidine kinase EvgS